MNTNNDALGLFMAYPLTREIFRQFSKQDEFLRLKSSALFLVAVGIPDRGNVVGNGKRGSDGGVGGGSGDDGLTGGLGELVLNISAGDLGDGVAVLEGQRGGQRE